ncbi:MAG: NAD(P)/FAD-dependent oxidoreductase, partial [Planctomycetota bacterium]|nr:NAD(P)/FAD-dependent oxidoreductase [Planctomycetota bacterium]
EDSDVIFEDGQMKAFDTVLLCTGYRARIDRIFPEAEKLINERGYPKWHGEEVPLADYKGLYFLGFSNPIAGALRQIHFEAVAIAKSIAAQLT